jgi:hypothetical protein
VRRLALILLVACGGKSEPRCADAFDALSKRLEEEPEAVTSLIGVCEQEKWPGKARSCVAAAHDGDEAAKCIAPVYGIKPPTPPMPSAAVKKRFVPGSVRALYFSTATADEKQYVEGYFKALGMPLTTHDRLVEVEPAQKYKVTKDSTLVLVRETPSGELTQTIDLGNRLRDPLKRLDREVSYALAKIMRDHRKLFVTSGHGEMGPERKTTRLDQTLAMLQFVKKDLAAADLAKDVPADANVVAILGAASELSADEQASLGRYLDRGGALLVTFDPKGIGSLGALDVRLGAKLATGHLVDDKNFLPQKAAVSDRQFVVTNKFSAHPTTTSLARAIDKGFVLVDGGALEAVPGSPKTTVVVKSLESSWLDLDGDYTFDEGVEKRQAYDLGVAVEAKYRSLVLADADLFADVLVNSSVGGRASVVMLSGPLFSDAVRWLAGEEAFSGEIVHDEPKQEPNPGERVLDHLRRLGPKAAR